jgi:hypothetical protein
VPYRLIYAGLALLAVAVVALGVALAPEGDPVELPGPIEAVSPAPGETVIRQAVLSVDLDIGYEATIFVDGMPIPDAQFVPATGVYTWAPHANSAVMTEWSTGEHTVRVEWLKVSGTPEGGEFEWSFRVH